MKLSGRMSRSAMFAVVDIDLACNASWEQCLRKIREKGVACLRMDDLRREGGVEVRGTAEQNLGRKVVCSRNGLGSGG